MLIDFKKEYKDLYQPKTMPSIIDVPEMVFIAVDGKGDPNTSAEYAAAVEVLYGLSYGIKMSNKAILEYVVPPLEGFWNVDGEYEGCDITDKEKFYWTALIRQPDFVTEVIFEAAKTALAKKKPNLDTSKKDPLPKAQITIANRNIRALRLALALIERELEKSEGEMP